MLIFARHTVMTRNSNQATRHSPPGTWTAEHKTIYASLPIRQHSN